MPARHPHRRRRPDAAILRVSGQTVATSSSSTAVSPASLGAARLRAWCRGAAERIARRGDPAAFDPDEWDAIDRGMDRPLPRRGHAGRRRASTDRPLFTTNFASTIRAAVGTGPSRGACDACSRPGSPAGPVGHPAGGRRSQRTYEYSSSPRESGRNFAAARLHRTTRRGAR